MNVYENSSITMLPPYVAPEHRELMDKAEQMLEDYQSSLLAQLKKKIFERYPNLEPHPSEFQEAEREFYEDPMRQHLIEHLIMVKLLCERPRFMIKPGTPSTEA